MTEEEKRYKIKKMVAYNDERKQINREEATAFVYGLTSLAVTVIGWNGMMEYLNLVPSGDFGYLIAITSSVFLGGSLFSIEQIRVIVSSILKKTKLKGKMEELNEEIELYEKNNSRRGRK